MAWKKGTLMKSLAGLLAVSAVFAARPAVADDIDLSAWTCQHFMTASKEDVGVILAWLDGYYKEEDEPPVIDTEQLVGKAKRLGEYCAANPDSPLIDVTDKLFQKQ
jgi:acid stress chaperone HdeB